MADILYAWKDLEKNLSKNELGYLHGSDTRFNEYKQRFPERIWIVRQEKNKLWLLAYLTVTEETRKLPKDHKKNFIFYDPAASFFFKNAVSVQERTSTILDVACAKMVIGNWQGTSAADVIDAPQERLLRMAVKEEPTRPLSEFVQLLKGGVDLGIPYRKPKGKKDSIVRKSEKTSDIPQSLIDRSKIKGASNSPKDDHQDKNEHSPFSGNPISADNSGESSIVMGIEASGDNSKVGEDISAIQSELESTASDIDIQFIGKPGKDIDVIVKSRVGQGPFRTLLIAKHGGRCCISGLDNRELLIASHIVRWSKSDPYQKTDSENGLLLSVSWDSVFDKGFVSFDGQGNLLCSDLLDQETARLLGISTDAKLPPELLTDRRKLNLSWHRENIFRGESKNTDS